MTRKEVIGELRELKHMFQRSYGKYPTCLEEVNITFTNLEPEPYYDFIKGKRFTGSAVFYKGEWYWYSSVTVDVLNEYGRYESEKIDEGIKIIAWQPLPEPYKEEE